jgi:hypothetical protein
MERSDSARVLEKPGQHGRAIRAKGEETADDLCRQRSLLAPLWSVFVINRPHQ